MISKPSKLRIKKVKVILSHSKRLTKLLTKSNIFFIDPFFQKYLSIFIRYWILKIIYLTTIFNISLKDDMTIALWRKMIG